VDHEVRQVVPPGWTQTAPLVLDEPVFAVEVTGGVATIHQFDPADGAILNSFAAPAAPALTGYQGLAVGTDSLFYVDANDLLTPTLYELDSDTGAVIDSDPLTFGAVYAIKGLAYLGGELFIQYLPDALAVWDPGTDALVRTVQMGDCPCNPFTVTGLTGAGDMGLLFGADPNGDIRAINPATGKLVTTLDTNLPSPDGGLAYVTGELLVVGSTPAAAVYRIDAVTGEALGSLTLAGGVGQIVGLGGDRANDPAPVNHAVTFGPSKVVENLNFGNQGPAVTGDINGDGLVDGADIDAVYAHFGSPADARYDLDGDGDADQADVDALVYDILETEYGDTNLDGVINATDAAAAKAGYGPAGFGWAYGDINGDGLVNATDVAIMKANFGFTRPEAPAGGGGTPLGAPAALPLAMNEVVGFGDELGDPIDVLSLLPA